MAFAESGQSEDQAPSGKVALQLLQDKNSMTVQEGRRETMENNGM